MIIISFLIEDKVGKSRFFEEIFLIVDINMDIKLGMLNFTLSSIEINFLEQKLSQKSYTTVEALSTTKRVKLVGKNKITTIVLDLDDKTFIVYIISLISTDIYCFYRVQIASLIQDNIFTAVMSEYIDFTIIFFLNLAAKLPEHPEINNHPIYLVKG